MKLLLLSLLLVVNPHVPQLEQPTDTLDTYLNHRMDVEKIPGISIAIVEPDGTVDFRNYGYADLEMKKPVNENTIYEIGSITKTFTAGILHILMDEKGLSADTKVNEIIPDSVQIKPYEQTDVTLHHVLTHHSGLPRLPRNFTPNNQADPYRDYTNAMMYDFLDDVQLQTEPGTQFKYSNLGYMLLGNIVEILSGREYDELVSQYVTTELEMNSTSRELSDSTRFATPTAGGYETHAWNFEGVQGLGELRSTASDMAKYLKMMMGITDYSFKDTYTNALELRLEIDENMYFAHSWFVNTSYEDEIIYHGGGTGGFSTFVGFSTKTGKGVVILSNSSNEIQDVGLHLLNENYELNEVHEYQQLEVAQLQRLVGVYKSETLPNFTVFKDGTQLYGQLDGQQALPLNAISPTEFENKTVQARITFSISGEKADTLTLFQAGQTLPFIRSSDLEKSRDTPDLQLTQEELQEFEGTYVNPNGLELTILLKEEQLTGRLTGQNAFNLYPMKHDVFYLKVVVAELHFFRNEQNEVTEAVLHQNGQEITFSRR